MMGFKLLLVCYCALVRVQGGEAVGSGECPHLDAAKLAKLKDLVVKEDHHDKIAGSSHDMWGAKEFFDQDPNTCVKHSRQLVNDTLLSQSVEAKGKWFGGTHKRISYLKKVDKNVYLEILPNQPDGKDLVLAKLYLIYAKNGVFSYFWCLMFVPTAEEKSFKLTSLAGVTSHSIDHQKPEVRDSIKEAVKKVQDNKDIFGDIEFYKGSCKDDSV